MPNNNSRSSAVVNSSEKIKNLDELAGILSKLKARKYMIVHCHGVFDLLHPGHIRHLKAAKRRGDVLVVTVTKDEFVNKGPGRPVFSQNLRAESLAALGCVDYVAINDTPTAVPAIQKLRPHFFAKGQDYQNEKEDITRGIILERNAVRSIGADLIFTEEPMMSSTQLLNNHFGVYSAEARSFLKELSGRHSSRDVIRRMEALRSMKVLIVGETIVDEYHYCEAMGKSPKETIVSTRYLREESFAGGALAAANHAAGFVSEVHLATCLGTENTRESFIRKHLKANVRPTFFYQDDVSTIIKRRFVEPAFLTKMFEVSFLEDRQIPPKVEDKFLSHLKSELPKYDVVLVTDYGHGMITPRMIELLCRKARFLAVNTQTNSANLGYNMITRYPRADFACIDEPELRLAEHNKTGDIEDLILSTTRKLKTDRMVCTRGYRGSVAYSKSEGFCTVPALSQKVVDRTGAGDAYLAVSSLCVANGFPMALSGFIGNAVAALKIGTVCNRTPVEPVALFRFITAMLAI